MTKKKPETLWVEAKVLHDEEDGDNYALEVLNWYLPTIKKKGIHRRTLDKLRAAQPTPCIVGKCTNKAVYCYHHVEEEFEEAVRAAKLELLDELGKAKVKEERTGVFDVFAFIAAKRAELEKGAKGRGV